MDVHLMRPEWLWGLLPVALLALLLWRERQQRGSWHSVISADLLPYLVGENAGEKVRNLLPVIFIAWILAVLAAAGPSWQKIPLPVHQKQDALVILLDLSYSMNSTDLAPSRIDRARQKLLDLLQQRREGQTGLIAYAGDAHIVTPLTDDTDTIANLLPALKPEMMPVPGSTPAKAVEQGIGLLHSAGIRGGRILLVTDGVTARDMDAITRLVRNADIQLGVMGIGTSSAAPIPMPRGGFLKDADGSIVMPRLEESRLQALAADTGGRYQRMQIDNSDLTYLLAGNPLRDSDATIALDRQADTWDDQGYLLLPPLLLLVLCLFRRGWLLSLVPLILVVTPEPTLAQSWDDLWLTPDQQGQQALQAGDNKAAAELFKHPEWAGTAAYREGDYESALDYFEQEESADSLYNRGNALARSGDLDGAIEAYRESLALQPEQQDAQDNIELLEQLKKQQEEQQKQQEDQQEQNQNQDQQEQEQEQSEDQSGGEQQEQDQQEQEQNNQNQGEPEQSQEQAQNQGQSDPEEDQDSQQSEASEGTQEEQTPAQQAEQEQDDNAENAATEAQDTSEQERDQAMEQWLRRVPDDPSGLLREKFRYESKRRQAEGETRNNEQYW